MGFGDHCRHSIYIYIRRGYDRSLGGIRGVAEA
jgi:hypothetical protein